MYYEVFVNGTSLGVFGHDTIRNMSLSVLVLEEGQDVFASAVCEEAGELYLYDWLQHPIGPEDRVEFRRAAAGPSNPPRRKRSFGPAPPKNASSPPNTSLEQTREG